MFDCLGLPNPIERLVFGWVQLNFGSILFDYIRWAKRKELSFKETLKAGNHPI